MSAPMMICEECGDTEAVRPKDRGFPLSRAKRALAKRCEKNGHTSTPVYRDGASIEGKRSE